MRRARPAEDYPIALRRWLRRRAAALYKVCSALDSLNPFIVKGIALQSIRGYVVEPHGARLRWATSHYTDWLLFGETDSDAANVIFSAQSHTILRQTPVTAEDVIFS
jgi:peptide/nickel transport system substrate-binding protein